MIKSSLILFILVHSGLALAQTPAASPVVPTATPPTSSSSASHIPMPQTLQLNREGNALLLKQSFGPALDKYIEALKYDPFQAELHLNMGLAFEGLQQADKAIQSYKQAERLATKPLTQFMSLFNQAQLLGKAKQVDEALGLYQRALEIDPTSKEAKTNIELLTQDQQGGGKGKDDKDDKDKKDDKNDDKKDQKDQKDPKDDKDKKGDNKEEPKDGKQDQKKQFEKSAKYQPKKFDSKDLSESDVKKILGELKQQEQKIRAEFNRKEVKEQPRDKDW